MDATAPRDAFRHASPQPKQSRRSAILIALAVLALAVRAPLLSRDPYSPDAFEYLNIGSNIAQGRWEMSIKSHFFDDKPVIHSALGERPLLLPLVIAAVMRVTGSMTAVDVVMLALGVSNVLLLLILGRKFLGRTWGTAVGLAAALHPGMVESSSKVWSEQLFLMMILLGLWCLLVSEAPKKRHLLLAGSFAALAYLTRNEGIFLALVCFAWLAIRPGRSWRKLAAYGLGFTLISFPYFIANTVVNGSPLYSVQSQVLRVVDWYDAMWAGFVHPPGTFLSTFSTHYREILASLFKSDLAYLKELAGLGNLSLLFPFLIVCLVAGTEEHLRLLVAAGMGILVVYLLMWAGSDPLRYLTAPTMLWLIPSLAGLRWTCQRITQSGRQSMRVNLIPIVILAVMFIAYGLQGAQYTLGTLRKPDVSWAAPTLQTASLWLAANTAPQTVVATAEPWKVNFLAGRPAILLPRDLDRSLAARFVKQYDVEYVLVRQKGAPPGMYSISYEEPAFLDAVPRLFGGDATIVFSSDDGETVIFALGNRDG